MTAQAYIGIGSDFLSIGRGQGSSPEEHSFVGIMDRYVFCVGNDAFQEIADCCRLVLIGGVLGVYDIVACGVTFVEAEGVVDGRPIVRHTVSDES